MPPLACDVADYSRSCPECQKSTHQQDARTPLIPLPCSYWSLKFECMYWRWILWDMQLPPSCHPVATQPAWEQMRTRIMWLCSTRIVNAEHVANEIVNWRALHRTKSLQITKISAEVNTWPYPKLSHFMTVWRLQRGLRCVVCVVLCEATPCRCLYLLTEHTLVSEADCHG